MVTILVVDDDRQNRYLLEVLFKAHGFAVQTAQNGLEALDCARDIPPDLAVCDILMPVMDGFALCREWRADPRLRTVPFVFYTATYTDKKDEDLALSLGADRFVVKPQEPDVLMSIIREVMTRAAVPPGEPTGRSEGELLKGHNEALFRKLEKKMAELESANCEIRETARDLRQFIMKCPLPIAISNEDGVIELVNERFMAVTGYTPDDIVTVDDWWRLAYPDPLYRARVRISWNAAQEKAAALGCDIRPAEEFQVTCKNGMVHTMEIYGTQIMHRCLVVFNDLTERIQLEAQLRQSQKMELVGHLAGGIAHDFNNILTGILGYGTLMGLKMAKDDPVREYLDHMLSGADRAAKLTQNLLAFSRKQILNPRPVNLNEIIRNIKGFLQRIIGEDITLRTALSDEALIVRADCVQVEQVLMNLATNARDAMPRGGTLTIESGAITPDAQPGASLPEEPAERYARLSVSDTGVGMDAAARAKIFEPFFTTKEVGKGTGLGMSIVYGIVKQHSGGIDVHSEPDAGTTVTIYLPIIATVAVPEVAAQEETPVTGTETILVADDDESVREIAVKVLSMSGYTVISATDGADALEKFRAHRDQISLVILDVIMPKVNGRAAYDEITRMKPGVKTLFFSGYTADVIEGRGTLDGSFKFIDKPFTPNDLLKMVRELLDGGPIRF